MKKIARYPAVVMGFFFIAFNVIMQFVFGMNDSFLRAVMSAFLAVFLSPRIKKIDTQNGKKKQITWIFLKTPLIID